VGLSIVPPLAARKNLMAQDDAVSRWVMFAIIGFGSTGVLCEILFSLKRHGFVWYFSDFFWILVLSSIVGGAVFWACQKLKV
jgi:hypothetical protein